ncbi:NifU family protein [uncultured Paracoccus sp.]|uniref:NifU family protein n=1 Tax=uncultured Paracoccus sp. TaxID=189685 RepID=UPI0026307A18|nr:NifU family protein [uncultured Paracoccus sp.]
MSDTGLHRRIRAQASPRDPSTMRFILGAPVQAGRTVSFDGPDDEAPLAKALFAIDGVRKVQVTGETILVTRAQGHDWQALKAQIAAAIRRVLDSADPPLGDTSDAAPQGDDDAAILAAVTVVLDRQANPAIARHGGHVSAERVENGVVYLRMSGGCQGCAASSMTLRNGVETMLRAAVPGVREIVDVTDHGSGTTPYYRDAPGRSPAFARPIPAASLRWEGGQLAIDPAYLAPRLGLEREQLLDGFSRGDIVTEHSEDATVGNIRVTVRSPQRTWAAEILPDGSAQEVPPPREQAASEDARTALADQVRQHLEALPAGRLPVTYGQIARDLGMSMPGSIREVTNALEVTMREDAETGRPFIAARAVSRGSGILPGRGFFELARSLERGPRPAETDQAFFQRELQESLRSG